MLAPKKVCSLSIGVGTTRRLYSIIDESTLTPDRTGYVAQVLFRFFNRHPLGLSLPNLPMWDNLAQVFSFLFAGFNSCNLAVIYGQKDLTVLRCGNGLIKVCGRTRQPAGVFGITTVSKPHATRLISLLQSRCESTRSRITEVGYVCVCGYIIASS